MRFRGFLSWELNDPVKVLMFLLTFPVLSYLLAVGYLHLVSGVGMLQGSAPPSFSEGALLSSLTASWLLTYPSLVPGFWILLALFSAVVAVFTFRYERDRGYAFSIYSLPYSKGTIYLTKLLSVIVFSLLVSFIPLLGVLSMLNVDVPSVVVAVLTSRPFLNLLAFTFYFVFFVISVSVLFGVIFRDMFLSFLAAFFLTVVPYFSSLSVPPFSFLKGITNLQNGVSLLSTQYAVPGLAIPCALLILSGIIFTRRDVL